jgi:hypothetical protein
MSKYLNTYDLWREADELAGGDWENPDYEYVDELAPEDRERLEALSELLEGFDGSEARHGVELIPEDAFEDYARQLAEDIGAVPEQYTWPISCIDWEYAARELGHDYSCVAFDGVYYLYQP